MLTRLGEGQNRGGGEQEKNKKNKRGFTLRVFRGACQQEPPAGLPGRQKKKIEKKGENEPG